MKNQEIYTRLLEINDGHTELSMAKQINDSQSRYDGGIPNEHTGLPSPSHVGTVSSIASMTCSLLNPDSNFYEDTLLLHCLERAVGYMLRQQHEDGTISPGSTNFHSPPDTAFVVNGLVEIYNLLEGEQSPLTVGVKKNILQFLERAVPALLEGGCHTPNHRWVMTAALAGLYQIFGIDALVQRAEEWLGEGIDCNEDGEWTERSNGIYNTVSDIMLYYTAKRLDRPELLQYVRDNLHMMVYFTHADGTVVTEYSDRQDYGGSHTMAEYFVVSRLMAAEDKEAIFAALSELAWTGMNHPGPANNHAMLSWLLYPQMRGLEGVSSISLPESYTRAFNLTYPYREEQKEAALVGHHGYLQHTSAHTSFGAPIVRIRQNSTSMTLTAETSSFLSINHKGIKLYGVRIASYFMPGVVTLETLSSENGEYDMHGWESKGYNGPIPKRYLAKLSTEEVSPWALLPHQHRPLTHVQQFGVQARLKPDSNSIKLHIKSLGTEDVLTQIQFLVIPDCVIGSDQSEACEGRGVFLRSGKMRLENAEGWIEIDGGDYQHSAYEIRNAAIPEGMAAVLVNLVTPFEHQITIRFS